MSLVCDCDWPDCDWPVVFVIDREPYEPGKSCIRHLGLVAFFKHTYWPLNVGWVGPRPLPGGLVIAKLGDWCADPFPLLYGVVTEEVWDDQEGAEPVDKT